MGVIKAFAGNFAPVNYMLCQGQTLNISQYTALFSILGTTYGGNGTTTFMLPNLCGRTIVGVGNGAGLTPITIGQVAGENNHALVIPEMPAHTHIGALSGGAGSIQVSSANASQSTATAGASIGTPGTGSSRSFAPTLGFNTSTPDTALNAASIASLTGTVTNQPTGSSLPHNNMQPYLGINYIICYQGLFPSRN